MLAETMDLLHIYDWDAKRAAERLGCSASQLIKLLKREPLAFVELNRQREHLGLGKLK
jgi:hypothetical protein